MVLESTSQAIALIVGSIVAALAALFGLSFVWSPGRRSKHNDVVGPTLNVIGTTYAVIIAFMLSGVWSNLRQAESNAEQEANDIVNVFRIAQALPDPTRSTLRQLSKSYAAAMVDKEWPAMAHGRDGVASAGMMSSLWASLAQLQPKTPSEQIGLDHAYYTLSSLTEHRRIREMQSRSSLPALLWAVLVVGAVVTITCACLFGVEELKVHMLQVFFLTFLIAIVLVAIADIDRPFSGPVHVSSEAFQLAIDSMAVESAPPPVR